jgi:hypothetical protein
LLCQSYAGCTWSCISAAALTAVAVIEIVIENATKIASAFFFFPMLFFHLINSRFFSQFDTSLTCFLDVLFF